MGLWDTLKDAANLVTGRGARVSLEFLPRSLSPGDEIEALITVLCADRPLAARGVVIDMVGREEIHLRDYYVDDEPRAGVQYGAPSRRHVVVRHASDTHSSVIQVERALSLADNETREFYSKFRIPADAQPTYEGKSATHTWLLRARLDVLGNDPSSGFLPVRVASRP